MRQQNLIEPRWVNIPTTQIIKVLSTLNLNTWHRYHNDSNDKHYLYSNEGYAYPYSLPQDVIDTLKSELNRKWVNMEWHNELVERAIKYYQKNDKPENQAFEYWQKHGEPLNLPKPEIFTFDDDESLPLPKPREGDYYIAILGLYKLTRDIAPEVPPGGLHHLYIDLVNENGKHIRNHVPRLFLWYEWEGMRAEEKPSPVQIDKPLSEPGGNIQINWNQVIRGFHTNNIGCEQFKGIHTRYPNGDGHHSHFIVLRKQRWQTQPIPPTPEPDPEPPTPEPEPKRLVMTIDKDWLERQPVKDGQYQIFGNDEDN